MKNKSQQFLDIIRDHTILGDGALGTELIKTAKVPVESIEGLNLKEPGIVKKLHKDYIGAGSRVIETNSFGANRLNLAPLKLDHKIKEINAAAVKLAREAVGSSDIFIAGSIGPVRYISRSEEDTVSTEDKYSALMEQTLILLEAGVDLLIFETFTDLDELSGIVKAARQSADIPIIAQMAFEEGGYTLHGVDGTAVARALAEAGADIIGANCGGGVPAVVSAVKGMLQEDKPVSAFLNAGFAEQFEGRHIFTAGDQYLAERAKELAQMNVRLIGGCCGTTPATIKAMAESLKSIHPLQEKFIVSVPAEEKKAGIKSEPVVIPDGILVELDPPKTPDLGGIIASASVLVEAGIRYITLADNPMASVRVDNIAVAGILHNKLGAMPIPHITGRDRNRIALQSSMMAAHCLGIRQLLCVTGDPIRMYHEANTTGVFDVNSVSLVKMASEFNMGQRLSPENRTAFGIGVAFNPNVRNLDGQINKLKRKIDAGANYVLTQPVYTSDRLEATMENLSSHGINIPVFFGLMPLSSSRNAEFLHNEVPGIVIPQEFRDKIAQFPVLADQRKAAMELAIGLAESLLKLNRLFYLITPQNKVELVMPVINFLKSKNVKSA